MLEVIKGISHKVKFSLSVRVCVCVCVCGGSHAGTVVVSHYHSPKELRAHRNGSMGKSEKSPT